MTKVSILGSTGSIGRQTLEVIERFPDRFKVCSLCAGSNTELLMRQTERFRPSAVCVRSSGDARELKKSIGAKSKVRVLSGTEGFCELAADASDTVVSAMAGQAGLSPTLSAVRAGKRIALANKEIVVSAGPVLMSEAAGSGAQIIPVDSEHSAIYQAMKSGGQVKRLIITASGGPFRNIPQNLLEKVTVRQALKHPTWRMGEKITVDSATMMNKAFEVIEAHRLFGIAVENISVWLHPQSIVHSIVEFSDGSHICQMSSPDMRVPIAYALSCPERLPLQTRALSPADLSGSTFERLPASRCPPLALARKALRIGGTMPAVMNAANEEAVRLFLERRIGFTGIVEAVKAVMGRHKASSALSPEGIFRADAWARKEVASEFSAD